MKIYLVGGSVRDKLLKLPSKDRDYAVLAENFAQMIEMISEAGWEVKKGYPDRGTAIVQHPDYGTIDVRMCRVDGPYSDGRNPDYIKPAVSLYEDSLNRDFTVNAMYIDPETNEIIDFHGGQTDLAYGLIRCVGNAYERFREDELRRLRALRFAVTKGMDIACSTFDVIDKAPRLDKIKVERIREELYKMFKFDTQRSWELLQMMPNIRRQIFSHPLILVPTICK